MTTNINLLIAVTQTITLQGVRYTFKKLKIDEFYL